ncbi:hypothetical protein PIB30_059996 [Stylosanthes scabra]|uniref:Uncharacterized protein n=1 Tax=Stylosanthes scabra TaxID=79078 RepID=A0ABU6SLE5_9FABA|nr:hypothetical protein [Stylosanthes scabra]
MVTIKGVDFMVLIKEVGGASQQYQCKTNEQHEICNNTIAGLRSEGIDHRKGNVEEGCRAEEENEEAANAGRNSEGQMVEQDGPRQTNSKTNWVGPEQSKTKTLEDDRDSLEVVRMTNLDLDMVQTHESKGRPNKNLEDESWANQTQNDAADFEQESVSSPLVTPGFEVFAQHGDTEEDELHRKLENCVVRRVKLTKKGRKKNNLRVKERTEGKRGEGECKKQKQKKAAEECIPETLEYLTSSEEEFSNIEVEAKKTWRLGNDMGLKTKEEARLSKHLRDEGKGTKGTSQNPNLAIASKKRGRKKKAEKALGGNFKPLS